ncbi:MAG TPA: YdcF family protein [Longimicrobiaceae bacterium]|nr:YdcF family protein [Longimicrobiaceae bacterium]
MGTDPFPGPGGQPPERTPLFEGGGAARAPAAPEPEPEPRPARRRRFRFFRLLVALAILSVAGWALTLAAIHLYGRRDEARTADAIVVLGAAQYDGRPSPVLRARLDHAIRLYRQGKARTLIMTGGVGPGDTVSEAVVSRRYAEKEGVPASAVLTERTGLTTLASLRAVADSMRSRGMRTALLVSDPFHMLRLKLLARRYGVRGYTSPTRSSPISENRDEERKHLLRESFSLPVAMLQSLVGG